MKTTCNNEELYELEQKFTAKQAWWKFNKLMSGIIC